MCLIALTVAGPALAHESRPGWRLRVTGVDPSVRGLSVESEDVLAPTLRVRNATEEVFEVIGADGAPFVRVSSRGVEANVAGPEFYRSESPAADGWVPPTLVDGAEPRFIRIDDGDAWAWFEHRIADPVEDADNTTTIPARLGTRDIEIAVAWERVQIRGSFTSVVDGVTPDRDGVIVRVLQGSTPALFVENTTDRTLVIPGPRGEPFLRIGPRGAEEADAVGRWSALGSAPRWAFSDRRLGPARAEPSPEVQAASEVQLVRRWSIGATLGDDDLEITGRVLWTPVAAHHAGGGWTTRVLVGAGLVVLFGLSFVVGRRVRRKS